MEKTKSEIVKGLSSPARDLMKELLGDETFAIIDGAFDCMETAERIVVEETKGLDQEIASRVSRQAFGVLCPPESFRGKAAIVYESHAREMIRRVIAHEDTRPGTAAECLVAMLYTAERAPLNQGGMVVTERLFAIVTGRSSETATVEQWPGQAEEDLAAIRKRLSVKDRVVKRK